MKLVNNKSPGEHLLLFVSFTSFIRLRVSFKQVLYKCYQFYIFLYEFKATKAALLTVMTSVMARLDRHDRF